MFLSGFVMLRLEKENFVAKVQALVARSQSIILADYRGLGANQLAQLRAGAREEGVVVCVVRNNLAKLALLDTDFHEMHAAMSGPVMMFCSLNGPSSAAKLLIKYTKDKAFSTLEVKALSLGGALLDAKQLKAISLLPTKEEALVSVVQTVQSPLMALAKVLSDPSVILVLALEAVVKKKKSTEGV
jgi:large subunit ribosomal protein L10